MQSVKQELMNLVAGQAITIEEKEKSVIAVMTLHELYQQGGSTEWRRNGKTSKAILLGGNVWLMRIPSKEAGEYTWIKFSPKSYSSNLREFYKGGDSQESWGPARKFAKNKQTSEVPYSLFDKEWLVTDIGAFQVETSENDEHLKNGDRIHFVTSKGKGDNSWLLYMDARHGEAEGTGGIFIGNTFQPEVEVASIL